jgi:hypothetical protein
MLAIRIALRLATMSRLEPPRARVAAVAFWAESTVFGPPKPIESARAEKSGRGGREAWRGGMEREVWGLPLSSTTAKDHRSGSGHSFLPCLISVVWHFGPVAPQLIKKENAKSGD